MDPNEAIAARCDVKRAMLEKFDGEKIPGDGKQPVEVRIINGAGDLEAHWTGIGPRPSLDEQGEIVTMEGT